MKNRFVLLQDIGACLCVDHAYAHRVELELVEAAIDYMYRIHISRCS